jgi:Bifunctional DNA primase/polymerase, N-terminal
MSALDLALGYAERWPVFPTQLVRQSDGTFDKVPCIKWGTGASRDPALIRAWWSRWPFAVVSIPTGAASNIIVLDVDFKKGRSGFDTLADLGKAILPETPMSHTASGGLHVFFARTDVVIRNSAGIKGLGLGLDVRGEGGQVVLPSGDNGYWWDPVCNFDTVAAMPAPAWLAHRPAKERPASAGNSRNPGRRFDPQAILAECCRRIERAPDGTKHDTYRQETFRVATMVRDGLLTAADARHALEPVIMALGKRADGHYGRVEHYYNLAFAEGLAAPSPRAARR